MSSTAFKRLSISDNFVVPYTANKNWDILSDSFSDKKITINIGVNLSESIFDPNNENETNNAYDRLVYESINLTYYPGFLNPVSPHNNTIQGTIYSTLNNFTTQSYYNGFIELGNKDTVKYFPTDANATIYVLNIPKNITGDKILPNTFELYFSTSSFSGKFYDDGNYNLYYSGSNTVSSINSLMTNGSYAGNIFYEQNVAILTIIPNNLRAKGWRGKNYTCVGSTVTYTTLEEYYLDSGATTGIIKANNIGDPNYIAPFVNSTMCASPPPTPSITPTVTSTPSVTPTVTPSVTPSVSLNTCTTYAIKNNGFGTVYLDYSDCSFVGQQVKILNNETKYICTVTPFTPGDYGLYTIKFDSIGCNLPVSPSSTPTPTITPSITITPSPSPASGGDPIVVEFNATLFNCGKPNDYIGYYVALDRVTIVNVYYTLRLAMYNSSTGLFSYYIYASGVIPAGSFTDTTNNNPCDGGGIYVGGSYYIGDVCISAIDYPVPINPFCLCDGICPSPSNSITPSITPSVTTTPSITVTPSITPSVTVTPSITPSPSV